MIWSYPTDDAVRELAKTLNEIAQVYLRILKKKERV